jgi:NitT/TauT family transport system substrate-binding protein
MGYRQILAAYCVAVLLCPVAATLAASPPTLRIAYSSISANTLPLWIALDQGLFAKHGVEAEAVYISGEPLLSQSIVGGDIAVAQQGAVGAIRSNLAGQDLTIFFGAMNTFVYSLVARPEIKRVEDLRGKKVGVGGSFGGPPAFATRWVLTRFGLQPNRDVALLLIRGGGQPERLAAVQAGTIDAILLSAPATLVAKKVGMRILVDLATLEAEYPQTVFTTTRSFIKKQPQAAAGITKALTEGIAVAKTRKDKASQTISKWLRISDPSVLDEIYREIVDKGFSVKPYPTVKGIQLLLNELASENPRAAKAKPEDFIDIGMVRALDTAGFIDALYR